MAKHVGKASVTLDSDIYIIGSASVAGTKEGEGPLGHKIDVVGEDDWFGGQTWEEAESNLQKKAAGLALVDAGLKNKDMDFILAGDLLGQSIATTFGMENLEIPLLGVYGACSTCGEALALGSMLIDGGSARQVLCVTSSHFASAEKEFRYPLEYGNQRPVSATWTVTGAGGFVLGNVKGKRVKAKITGLTVGKVVDYGLKESMNMGACMAPAAADTLCSHFKDMGTKPSDYDRIITGDLGLVGQKILLDLMKDKGYDIENQHMDCGIEIFRNEEQGTGSGGSGCGCASVVLSSYILEEMMQGNWKKILFLPTGALLSKTSFQEGKSVPAISHLLVLESIS